MEFVYCCVNFNFVKSWYNSLFDIHVSEIIFLAKIEKCVPFCCAEQTSETTPNEILRQDRIQGPQLHREDSAAEGAGAGSLQTVGPGPAEGL